MRPFETLLSVAVGLALFSLILKLPTHLHWLRLSVFLATVLGLLQLSVEGWRWQIIPLYVLTILLVLSWFISQTNMQVSPWLRLIFSLLGIASLIVAIALPLSLPIFRFPQPSGPYAIGTVTYHWIDDQRPELFTTDSIDHRELVVQVWYPAEDTPSAPRARYLREADYITPYLSHLFKLPDFFLSHLKYVTTHAMESAPIAVVQTKYPLLIFLSGLNGYRSVNMFQIENLVSHGYIVVGIDQPGAMAAVHLPDGRTILGMPRVDIQPLIEQSVQPQSPSPSLQGVPLPEGIIPYWAQDVSFVLDQLTLINQEDPQRILTQRLDLNQIGVFGISLGGMNAAESCFRDARLKACQIMDVFMPIDVVEHGLTQPTMWITRDADSMRLERKRAGGWTEQDIALHQMTMRAAYAKLQATGYYLQIPLIFHLNMTDVPYYSPLMPYIGMISPLDRQRLFDIINAYTLAFFDKHLKNENVPLLDGASAQYPEVQFETKSK